MRDRDRTFSFDIATLRDIPILTEEDVATLERDLATLFAYEQAGHTYRAKVKLTASKDKVPPGAAYLHANAVYLIARLVATVRRLEEGDLPVPEEE